MTLRPAYGDLAADLALGSVLCAIDEPYEDAIEIYPTLPKVRLSSQSQDPAVYGVFAGWVSDEVELATAAWDQAIAARPWLAERLLAADAVEDGRLRIRLRTAQVAVSGAAPAGVLVQGTCQLGDLLQTSDTAGAAEAAPEGADPRCILGKALGGKASEGMGLVRAVLWVG